MQIEIHRILFPTDFSETARQAQKYAQALAEKFGAELHLIHVVAPLPTPVTDGNVPWIPQESDLACEIEQSNNALRKEVGADWATKHHVVYCAEVGFAVDEILQYARVHDIDLIVCGTHGLTGLSHLLLGSVAEKLVRVANCPVLTVHPKGHQFVVEETQAGHTAALVTH